MPIDTAAAAAPSLELDAANACNDIERYSLRRAFDLSGARIARYGMYRQISPPCKSLVGATASMVSPTEYRFKLN